MSLPKCVCVERFLGVRDSEIQIFVASVYDFLLPEIFVRYSLSLRGDGRAYFCRSIAIDCADVTRSDDMFVLERRQEEQGRQRQERRHMRNFMQGVQGSTFGAEIITKIIGKFRNSVSVIEINSKIRNSASVIGN